MVSRSFVVVAVVVISSSRSRRTVTWRMGVCKPGRRQRLRLADKGTVGVAQGRVKF